MKVNNILCAGAALFDLLLRESDAFLAGLGREKGGMVLVEKSEIDRVLKASSQGPDSMPGGSACNTAVGLARLGAKVCFFGKRGDDDLGESMEGILNSWGVQCRLLKSKTSTGQVLSVITPDAQRTMFTYLGASAELSPQEITPEIFTGRNLLHLEGYLLFNRDLALKVIDTAREAGCRISLDLASFEVVRANRDILPSLIRDKIDIIIANEDEAREFTGKDPAESLEILSGMAEIAVVKEGAQGVRVSTGGKREKVEGLRVKAIDTTGAGDLWASGFLCGLSRGWDLRRSAMLGNATGAAVVQVVGASIPNESYDAILDGPLFR
ncbi:MAG: adenosine kinase [Planctomycetes bacterium]|nr:adenosine kinase [Planctomycetota bacterium]